MKEAKTFCDHCGKQINQFTEYGDLEIELNHIGIETDLCAECFDELCDIIKNFCKKEGKRK